MQSGKIGVTTENIFPIIKKWLYSEKDIFLREIVSNATDAVTKYKRLQSLGEIPATDESYRIIAAKAADKLMTIAGIEASFALLRADNTVTISARSHDKINVQLIMEKIGGGGHAMAAGMSMQASSLDEVSEIFAGEVKKLFPNEE